MLPNVIKSWNLFVDGRGYLGRAEKVKLPKLESETEDWRGGGMLSAVKLDFGLKALELEFTLGEYTTEILKLWNVRDVSGIQARFLAAAVSGDGGTTDAIEVAVRGRWESTDFGDVEAKKQSKLDVKMPLTYYRYSVNGSVVHEIDVLSGLWIVDGVNITEAQMQAIGVTA